MYSLLPDSFFVHRRLVHISKVWIVSELQEGPITPLMHIAPENAQTLSQHPAFNFELPVWHPGTEPHFYEPHLHPLWAYINSLGVLSQFQGNGQVLLIHLSRHNDQESQGHTAHDFNVDAKPYAGEPPREGFSEWHTFPWPAGPPLPSPLVITNKVSRMCVVMLTITIKS